MSDWFGISILVGILLFVFALMGGVLYSDIDARERKSEIVRACIADERMCQFVERGCK